MASCIQYIAYTTELIQKVNNTYIHFLHFWAITNCTIPYTHNILVYYLALKTVQNIQHILPRLVGTIRTTYSTGLVQTEQYILHTLPGSDTAPTRCRFYTVQSVLN